MVDVMLALLVTFMVTAPLLSVGVPLDLPKSKAAAITQPKEPIILSLNRDDEVFIGDDNVARPDRQAPANIRAASSMCPAIARSMPR
jgi:biopolymer transport protein ExbD